MEYLTNLISLGSAGFWIYCAVWVMILSFCAYDDNSLESKSMIFWIIAGSLLLCFLLWLISDLSIIAQFFYSIAAHPLASVSAVAGYLLAGIGWAMTRLYFHGRKSARRYQEYRDAFLKANGCLGEKEIPAKLKKKWDKECKEGDLIDNDVKKYRKRLIFWMTWWPFSVIGVVVIDYVVRLFEAIYDACEKYFKIILDKSFNTPDFRLDFETDRVTTLDLADEVWSSRPRHAGKLDSATANHDQQVLGDMLLDSALEGLPVGEDDPELKRQYAEQRTAEEERGANYKYLAALNERPDGINRRPPDSDSLLNIRDDFDSGDIARIRRAEQRSNQLPPRRI